MKKLSLVLALVLVFSCCLFPASAEEVVNIYNWYDYMDESIFEDFYKETGIKVNCMYFTTNEDMMVQVRVSPGAYDVVFPSEYCVERMIKEDLLAEINMENVPNAQYIDPSLLGGAHDPENKYSIPFMWGTVGILYDTTKVTAEEVSSWGILWDEKYADQIFMMDSIRDTMGLTLKYLGYSMNTRDPLQLKEATDKLIAQKPLVKAYQVDETKDKMVNGEAALAVVWSGDALYAMDLNENLDYSVPQEGSNVWVDAVVIPKTAKNKENAEKFIDFLCRPDIAQRNCEYIWYSSPNTGAIELMGEDYTENLAINPSQDIIDRCEWFQDIPENYMTVYNALWSQVKNAK